MLKSTEKSIEIVWNYLQLHQDPTDSDAMIVLGSRDDRVAAYAAQLAAKHNYGNIVISGGVAHKNDLLATNWGEKSEAEHFYNVMQRHGLVRPVYIEDKAENTGDNAIFSYQMLADKGINPKSVTIATKPYMERRALATFEEQWPNKRVILHVTSFGGSFDDYVSTQQPSDLVVNIMVGDLHRIMEYPRLGLQSEQPAPGPVMAAFEQLVAAGYGKMLLK